jgi:hypothetical protein
VVRRTNDAIVVQGADLGGIGVVLVEELLLGAPRRDFTGSPQGQA